MGSSLYITAVLTTGVLIAGNLAIVTVTKVPLDKAFCIDTVCLPDENTLFTEDADQKCKTASWGLPGASSRTPARVS